MHIYKQYDQAALNHQYNNRELVPDFQVYFDLYDTLNKEAAVNYKCIADIPYGEGPRQKLDFFPAKDPGRPTMIFIHGGYWQMMDRPDFRFIARAFVPHRINLIMIGYPIAPIVNMDTIIESIRQALTWIHHHMTDFGVDIEQLYLCGHSAGGHLASMMVTTKYAPENIKLKGICALSGLYDLRPIQLSHVNGPLHMDVDMAIRCSPIQYDPLPCPIILAVGSDESDEYHAQCHDLATRWSGLSSVISMNLTGVNHFSILLELLDEKTTLFKDIKAMIVSNTLST